MDQILQDIIDFYKNNEKLAIAILSLIVGWFLKELFPAILSFLRFALFKVGKLLSG